MRYHGGAFNLKRLGGLLVNIRPLSCSGSSDLSDMGHCNHLAGRGAIYLAVSGLPPYLSSLLNSVPSQSRLSPTKWVFLFTRYFGLFVQLSVISLKSFINPLMWGHPYLRRLLSVNLSLMMDGLSVDVCRDLYISQVVFGGILLACIQAILMLRGNCLTTIQVGCLIYAPPQFTLFISKTVASHMR